MGRPRGVRHDSVRLDLSDGDWIDVRRVLTVGEERAMHSLTVSYRADGTADLDPIGTFAPAASYITGWSFVSADNGLPIPWMVNAKLKARCEVLSTLDPATMDEIDAAIRAHREAVANDPNGSGGGTGTGKTLPSAAA